jgi:nucleoside phosphorylase
MRALHLIGLRGAGGRKLRFYPAEVEPLMLPSWLSVSDREIILAFYQQILGDEPLPRVEVDWYRSLVPADRSYLQHLCDRHGAGEYLVVVKVRGEGVVFEDVARQPELQPFQHLAVVGEHELAGETYGRLREVTQFVQATAEEIYDELVAELSLREDGTALLQPLLGTLLNPVLIVEAYNALVDVHAEGLAHERHRSAVYRRIMDRLLHDLPPLAAVALAALAARGPEALASALGEPQRIEAVAALQARMLVLDGRLVRWARLLVDDPLRADLADALRERLAAIARPKRAARREAQRVLPWYEPPRAVGRDRIRPSIEEARALLAAGKLGGARDVLSSIEPQLLLPGIDDEVRANFWDVVARSRALKREGGREHRVDALIVTTTPTSYEAVLAAGARAAVRGPWTSVHDEGPPCAVHEFPTLRGVLRIGVTQASGMGSTNALIAAARAVRELDARCLALCSTCLGRPLETRVGDVVIANRLLAYDPSRLGVDPTHGQKVKDVVTYRIAPEWRDAARKLAGDVLTGRLDIGLPKRRRSIVHVAPIASVDWLADEASIFDRLAAWDNRVLGLDTEAAAIAAFAHAQGLPYAVVVEGIEAVPASPAYEPHLAARAAAEILITFLCENLPSPQPNEPGKASPP